MNICHGMRVHFMGIGGIGVSALADICAEQGMVVSGCDLKLNGTSDRLRRHGAALFVGHDPRHVDESVDLVVYSAAVRADNPELLAATSRGIPTLTRGELLAELALSRRLVAVAGAHGKTTTSAMASELLLRAGWDPTIIVGGVMVSSGTNARAGRGAYLVAETDESDGSFLHLSPEIAIITNIDREHLNHYRHFDRLVEAFQQFVDQIKPHGTLIRCHDDPWVRRLLAQAAQLSYGLDPSAEVTIHEMLLNGYGSRFHAAYNGRSLGTFQLQLPGQHNAVNALGVIALGLVLEIPLVTVRETLANFRGTERRFQVTRLPGDIWFVEDYAHHPAEIQATLAADTLAGRRRLAIFQPHRFTRTRSLEQEFALCFDGADGVIVTDIYPAFEPPIPGITGARLADLVKAHGHPCVRYVPKDDLRAVIPRLARPGDTVFFLGAGDIGQLCHDMADELRAPGRAAR
jgi:UDP-N-acetylmuramate--alanine ligase